MKQIYANNAKTTLTQDLLIGSSSLIVADASKFPVPGANEFFLVTLEYPLSNGTSQIEIIGIIGVSGNTLITNSLNRGLEGSTNNASFPANQTKVECRVTRDTLESYSTAFLPLSSINALVAPVNVRNTGYICETFDPLGNQIISFRRDDLTWSFLNYTRVDSGTTGTSTTTSLNSSTSLLASTTGASTARYLIQFTSGPLSGYVRMISSLTGLAMGWSIALPTAPSTGVTFEIFESNISIYTTNTVPTTPPGAIDDAITMSLVLGG